MQDNGVRLRRLQEREEEGVDLRLRQQVRHKCELKKERETSASPSSEMLREELLQHAVVHLPLQRPRQYE